MKVKAVENRSGKVVIILDRENGPDNEIMFNSMDAMEFLSAAETVLKEVIDDPSATSYGSIGIHHLQFRTMPNGDQFFCVYVGQSTFHEYKVPPGTTLSTELKLFADRVEAQNLARATTQPPGSRNN